MYGPNIEKLLFLVNQIISRCDACLTNTTSNSIRVDGSHTHSDGSHSSTGTGSHSHTFSGSFTEISSSASLPSIYHDDFSSELNSIKLIMNKLYVDTTQLNNGIGSPYTELLDLDKVLKIYNNNTSGQLLSTLGSVIQRMLCMNVKATAINTKFAIIIYHDSLQKAYDSVINQGKQSIVTDDFGKEQEVVTQLPL